MPIKKKKAVYSEKRLYELMAMFPGEYTKRDEAKFIDVIKKHLNDVGADVQRLESWGERLLTYPIGGHDSACFIFSHFVLDSEQVAALSKDLRLNTDVLRSLITIVPHDYKLPETAELAKEFLGLNREPVDPEEAELMRDTHEKRSNRRRNSDEQKPQTSTPKSTSAKKTGAGMEQLDKKLDEILSK